VKSARPPSQRLPTARTGYWRKSPSCADIVPACARQRRVRNWASTACRTWQRCMPRGQSLACEPTWAVVTRGMARWSSRPPRKSRAKGASRRWLGSAAIATIVPETGDRKTFPPISLQRAHELQRPRKGVLVASDVVLVVDDDAAFLRAVERLLKAQGFAVEIFESAEAFHDHAAQNALCVILDINLGEVSGIDVRRHLAGAYPSMPVIFMSANDSERLREAALDAGCIGYLVKPFTPASLMGAIARARQARGAAPGSASSPL
jgi:CheY-like chemotaxis protein